MNRLVLFLCASSAVQALFFSALAPLLPSFERQLGLSKAQAGLLVAMFPLGQAVAALPIGLLASRVSIKRFALGGLAALAVASAAFGFVESYGALLVTRLLQGAAAAVCFSSGLAWLLDRAPRERRGELIGVVWGANAGGNVLGPAVGGLAVLAGRAGVFAAVAGLTLLLALAGFRSTGPVGRERQLLASVREAHDTGSVFRGLGIVALSALLFGTIFVLAPLQLDRAGWGPVGIAGTFLVAAGVGVVARPLIGRWADSRGLPGALRLLLLAAVPVTLVVPLVDERWVLCFCIVCAVTTYGMLSGPAMALVAHIYEEAGVAHVLGFALMGLTVGIGFFVGSAVGGEIAHLAGDVAAYSFAAGTCLATAVVLALRPQSAVFAKLRGL
jgi:predicted MFS family arabinose efflux permease